MHQYRRFSDTSMSEKILDSMFLLMIGTAYLFAILQTYYTHQGRDGEPGLSVKDVMIAYYGKHEQTRLGAAVVGSMAGNFPSVKAKQDVLDWIENGGSEEGYKAKVKPILDRNCIMCHSQESGMPVPSLETYDSVKALTTVDTGASIQTLIRVSHIHLFGIGFILFLVGRIFILCEMPVLWKRVIVVIPFVAVMLDIMAWYITKVVPSFAYVVVFAGGLMGISLWVQILLSGYQMWFLKTEGKGEEDG